MGEVGEVGPGNSVRPFFSTVAALSQLLWFMELTSPPLATRIFFKLWGMCFRAPRCCPWEPNNYGAVRTLRRGQASGAQEGAGKGGASPPVSWTPRHPQ